MPSAETDLDQLIKLGLKMDISGLGTVLRPEVEKKLKELSGPTDKKHLSEATDDAVAATKQLLGDLKPYLYKIYKQLKEHHKDEPDLAKWAMAALDATFKQGVTAIVKGKVAPSNKWESKPTIENDTERAIATRQVIKDAKHYLGYLKELFGGYVNVLVRDLDDDFVKLVWSAFAASIAKGIISIIHGVVAPPKEWEVGPEDIDMPKAAEFVKVAKALVAAGHANEAKRLLQAFNSTRTAAQHADLNLYRDKPSFDILPMEDGIRIGTEGLPEYLWADNPSEVTVWLNGIIKRATAAKALRMLGGK